MICRKCDGHHHPRVHRRSRESRVQVVQDFAGLPVVDGEIIGPGDRATLDRLARERRGCEPKARPCRWCSRGWEGHTSSWAIVVGGRRTSIHSGCYDELELHTMSTACVPCLMESFEFCGTAGRLAQREPLAQSNQTSGRGDGSPSQVSVSPTGSSR